MSKVIFLKVEIFIKKQKSCKPGYLCVEKILSVSGTLSKKYRTAEIKCRTAELKYRTKEILNCRKETICRTEEPKYRIKEILLAYGTNKVRYGRLKVLYG